MLGLSTPLDNFGRRMGGEADLFAFDRCSRPKQACNPAHIVHSFLLCLILFMSSGSLMASNSSPGLTHYYHTSWSAKDGAPADIQRMAQTKDGFIWLGTSGGLYRFDGVHFEKFQSQSGQILQRDNIYTLAATLDGGLWIGYYLGGLDFLKNGLVTHFTVGKELPASPALNLISSGPDSLWASLVDGSLLHFGGGKWEVVGKERNFPGHASRLLVDNAGTLWVETSFGEFFLPKSEHTFRRFEAHKPGIIAANDALVLIATPSQPSPKVRRKQTRMGGDPFANGYETFIAIRDKHGMFWQSSNILKYAASAKEIAKLVMESNPSKLGPSFIKADLTGTRPSASLLDREGNIWVGTELGLNQFRWAAVVPVTLPPGSAKFSLARESGRGIWATSYYGLKNSTLSQIQDGRLISQKAIPGAISLYRDPKGVLWIGTHGKRTGKGKIVRLAGDEVLEIGTPSDPVGAMTSDGQGRLWALQSGKGYFRYEHGKWTSLSAMGAPEHGALISFTDLSGGVWFGYQRDRVVELKNENTLIYSTDQGVRVGNVSIIQGGKSGLWIGGERGLERFDGHRFNPLLPIDRKEFSNITGIVPTENDGLWFGESHGIVHVSEMELRRFIEDPSFHVTYRTLDTSDGLPASLQPPYPSPAAIQSADGLVWFATAAGIVWVDPKDLPVNSQPPPVSILQPIVANDKSISWVGPGSVHLPAHTTNLQIAYTALSFSNPGRVRFRYRLRGLDISWQEAGNRRVAVYTNLAPGTYTFQVTACNENGVWNESGDTLKFTIAPAFYQTWWFKFGYIALGGFCLWLFYLNRLSHARAEVERRLGAKMEERERIARELHDTLLQGFQGLMLRFQAVMKLLPVQEPAHRMMEGALDRADQVLLEGRQSVRDIRERGTTGEELSQALSRCGEELASENSPTYSLGVVGHAQPLVPIVFDETYKIVREAMINAFQHSNATKIEVEIIYGESQLCLRIRDDGKGIDKEILDQGRSGHWGLSGMRERAQQLGSQLDIWSHSGAGTEIELKVPASVAYLYGKRKTIRERFLYRIRGANL